MLPSLSPMTLSIIVFVITYLFIASEKIDKSIAALLGACTVVALHVANFEELIHKVDLNVMALLIGMMMIVDIMATTGIFEWVAVVIARKSKGNVILIVAEFLLVTAVISALLDNVTTVILIAPITILITQILEIPTVPILILEAVFSNIGGTATLVGDPPNIIIGTSCKLSFNEFLFHLSPVVCIICVLAVVIVLFMMRKSMKAAPAAIERVAKTRPELAIIDRDNMIRSLVVFCLVIVGFFLSRTIGVEPGIIALGGGFLMAMVCRVSIHRVLEKVEWSTIMFFAGLFVLIGALEANHFFEILGDKIVAWTSGNFVLTVMVILWSSAIFSAIVDNIPLVIAMIPLIKSIIPVFAHQMGLEGTDAQTLALVKTSIEEPLLWSLALGACLGGNGTLIGASANVVISQIARKNKYRLSFWDFTRYGLPMMFFSLIISSFYVYFRYLSK